LKAHVLETIKVVERKRPAKELTCPLFWVSWDLKCWIIALIKLENLPFQWIGSS